MPPPGNLPNLGTELRSHTLHVDSSLSEPSWKKLSKKLYFYPTINIFHLYNLWTMVKMQTSLIKYLAMHAHHFTVSTSCLSLNFPQLYSETLVQFSSAAHSCTTLCDPMNHSMPDLPVHHQLPEFTQTHVH